ncbi:RNA-binding S4 domain-containing protein [Pelagicoccus mobilis]|uniref:RNA-binding S4 domain-containing protein n=1 Tax=Pelagicoccus mobilis TaxID=415221 RepID=A0A934VJI8_9BACT|nr:S4 domain-containing protein [Pelagicoccus mobilis]MBK1875661.1 RNA-binding S4 domain-containing protein [Pelagicoccus mobilis]
MEKTELEKVRIDRWLWAVRVFKTRGAAAEACKGGKVEIGGENVKPSRLVRVGEKVDVNKEGVLREYRVVGLLLKRVGAKVVANFVEDLTPPERLEVRRETVAQRILQREAGSGRPTKRERREIDRLFGGG